jgi:hypothetical protein
LSDDRLRDGFSQAKSLSLGRATRGNQRRESKAFSAIGLCEELANHVAVNIGQPVVASLEAESEAFVVESEQVDERVCLRDSVFSLEEAASR